MAGFQHWAVLHSLVALALVATGRYGVFETTMKVLIGLMVVALLFSVIVVSPDLKEVFRGLIPALPKGSATTILSLMGGVGGSVTLLAYGYWIREKGWSGAQEITKVRVDLTVGYLLTGLIGIAMLVVAATVLGGGGGMPAGSQGLVACGDAIRGATALRFGHSVGRAVAGVFLFGVWGAIFSSMLGVWNGVPYLFHDFMNARQGRFSATVDPRSAIYRGYLLFLALPPMILLYLDRPIWVIKLYTLTGGLFMPLLAGSLLWLNSRRALVGRLRNGFVAVATPVLALGLFALIAGRQIADML
jgi:Mn2+/Fe2+ NRAMP family transporter